MRPLPSTLVFLVFTLTVSLLSAEVRNAPPETSGVLRRAAPELVEQEPGTRGSAATGEAGTVFVSGYPSTLYEVDLATGEVAIFAQDGLAGVSGLALDGEDLLALNHTADQVVRLAPDGELSVEFTAADGVFGPFGANGIVFGPEGDLYVSNYNANEIIRFPGGVGPSEVVADSADGVVRPDGLAFDSDGKLLVANRQGGNVLQVEPSGVVNVFDLTPCDPHSIQVASAGDIYLACLDGDVYHYVGGDVGQRVFVGNFGSGSNTAILLDADEASLYLTSYDGGELLLIDPASGDAEVIVPPGGVEGGLALALRSDAPCRANLEILGDVERSSGTLSFRLTLEHNRLRTVTVPIAIRIESLDGTVLDQRETAPLLFEHGDLRQRTFTLPLSQDLAVGQYRLHVVVNAMQQGELEAEGAFLVVDSGG